MRTSVVIPARNEESRLPSCLRSLADQLIQPDEIIVVDNGSTDATASVARAFGCKVVVEPVAGVGRARFRGCSTAVGDIILNTDADTQVPVDWVARILDTFQARPACVAVMGPWLLCDGQAWKRYWVRGHGLLLRTVIANVAPFMLNLTGCNGAVRAEAYRQVGGFRPDLLIGEDLHLSLRLRSVGEIYFRGDLVVRTSGRRFEKSLLRGLGVYIPDIARQMMPYVLGERDHLPGLDPAVMQTPPSQHAPDAALIYNEPDPLTKLVLGEDGALRGVSGARKAVAADDRVGVS